MDFRGLPPRPPNQMGHGNMNMSGPMQGVAMPSGPPCVAGGPMQFGPKQGGPMPCGPSGEGPRNSTPMQFSSKAGGNSVPINQAMSMPSWPSGPNSGIPRGPGPNVLHGGGTGHPNQTQGNMSGWSSDSGRPLQGNRQFGGPVSCPPPSGVGSGPGPPNLHVQNWQGPSMSNSGTGPLPQIQQNQGLPQGWNLNCPPPGFIGPPTGGIEDSLTFSHQNNPIGLPPGMQGLPRGPVMGPQRGIQAPHVRPIGPSPFRGSSSNSNQMPPQQPISHIDNQVSINCRIQGSQGPPLSMGHPPTMQGTPRGPVMGPPQGNWGPPVGNYGQGPFPGPQMGMSMGQVMGMPPPLVGPSDSSVGGKSSVSDGRDMFQGSCWDHDQRDLNRKGYSADRDWNRDQRWPSDRGVLCRNERDEREHLKNMDRHSRYHRQGNQGHHRRNHDWDLDPNMPENSCSPSRMVEHEHSPPRKMRRSSSASRHDMRHDEPERSRRENWTTEESEYRNRSKLSSKERSLRKDRVSRSRLDSPRHKRNNSEEKSFPGKDRRDAHSDNSPPRRKRLRDKSSSRSCGSEKRGHDRHEHRDKYEKRKSDSDKSEQDKSDSVRPGRYDRSRRDRNRFESREAEELETSRSTFDKKERDKQDVDKHVEHTLDWKEKEKVDKEDKEKIDPAKVTLGSVGEESPSKESELHRSTYSEDIKRINEEQQEMLLALSKETPQVEKKTNADEETSPEPAWIRCSPADLYLRRDRETNHMISSKKMQDLENKFESELLHRAQKVRDTKPPVMIPPRPPPVLHHHCHHDHKHNTSDCSDSASSEEEMDEDLDITDSWMEEMNRKKQHPERLHEELWFNEYQEMNDGPLCRCSLKSRRSGIRHDIYPGESPIPRCDIKSNASSKLFHYRITMSPHTNFLMKCPTVIEHDSHEYIFEGFSLFSHYRLENVPVCKVIRFNIEYTVHWFEEDMPEHFSIRSLDLFSDFLFNEILELVDMGWKSTEETCRRFHLMPRFVRGLPDNGKEILSMNEVLSFLLRSSQPLIAPSDLAGLSELTKHDWQSFVDKIRFTIVTKPGMRPSSIRIDQLDRETVGTDGATYPTIIHFGIRPAQLSYAGDPKYQKMWKQYVKLKHLLANKPKVIHEDRHRLAVKEVMLQEMRMKSSMKRDVTVELNAEGFVRTGIKSDVCQHAMLLPVLLGHLRFHKCLTVLEEYIEYTFQNRILLQLALTHPSFRVNFGTNPDHARNSLSNCGIRQPEYGDRNIHHMFTRKRGINTLISIMSRLGKDEETTSRINHYERLEFLGDAVVEFLSSIHLFFMFPSLEEGGLATYRAAIVRNQHLSVLAKKLNLQDFMLYAHGPDLCHELDLKHAMANCLEALMGALLLDAGIELADRVFGKVLYGDDPGLLETWMDLPLHPLQEDELKGDRHWIGNSPVLQKMTMFEEKTGMRFNHIRLLARAFTLRNVGYNNLTFGHNQRLEFLGDTVLQLVSSAYLFKHFPEHHEGHLSLLRSSLVNNRTQAVVCDDIGMTEYIIQTENSGRMIEEMGMKRKEKADLLEALIGALYVDQGLEACQIFCEVCFFPRLQQFILSQGWNDPKSQLQQCCLTLRELDGEEPDIPNYKVIASTGPTNTRKYTVAVYFRGERLATGEGHSIQQAEMNAATNALKDKADLFPQLTHQKKFIQRMYKGKPHNSDQELDRQDARGRRRPREESRDMRGRERQRTGDGNRGCDRKYSSDRNGRSRDRRIAVRGERNDRRVSDGKEKDDKRGKEKYHGEGEKDRRRRNSGRMTSNQKEGSTPPGSRGRTQGRKVALDAGRDRGNNVEGIFGLKDDPGNVSEQQSVTTGKVCKERSEKNDGLEKK